MASISEFLSAFDFLELLHVMWMEVAIAGLAASVYFTLTGWVALPAKKPEADADAAKGNNAARKPIAKACQDPTTQLVNKALRQGKLANAISLLKELPGSIDGHIPANVAPRLLMAVAKAPNFDDTMTELSILAGKIEARSLEAVVMEAMKNKDVAACRQLQLISRAMSIPKSDQTLEALATALASDADALRMLVEDAKFPLARPFAKAVLKACAALKDVDLAAEVFEKAADSDAAALRVIVEKAATPIAPAVTADCGSAKGAALHAKEIRASGKNGDLKGALQIFEKQRTQSVNTLLYNSIIDACVECNNLEKAMEYFIDAQSNGFADVITYNMAMKGYLSQGRVDAAKSLLAQLSEKGLVPTVSSYHGLLNFHVSTGNLQSAWKVVKEMEGAAVAPTAVTCSILLKGKLSSADTNRVLSLVDKIEPMDEVLFSALADACIRTGQVQLLSTYKAKLSCQGRSLPLAAPTYGSMIKAYGQIKDVKSVWDLWGEMMRHHVQPTAITLGCMVESLVANRCTGDAWKLVRQMRNEESTRLLLNTVIYSTILKGFAYSKDIDKVMALYEEMKDNNIHANNITFNTILNAFAQGGAMDRVPALLEDMRRAVPPADPDIVTYSTIVKGYCNSGCLDRALEVLKEMQSDGKFTADEVMYNSILDGCAKEHRPNEALKLLDDMKRLGVAPSNYTLSIMVKLMGRCRRMNQAFSIIEDVSNEYGLKVNIQVYTCLIQGCFNNRQPAKAVALHDQIINEGLVPDEMTYSALVKGCLQAGLIDKAVQLTKSAHGLATPRASGTPPGIGSRCLDELLAALGDWQAKALMAELKGLQTGTAPAHSGRCKGVAKGGLAGNAPWRQRP